MHCCYSSLAFTCGKPHLDNKQQLPNQLSGLEIAESFITALQRIAQTPECFISTHLPVQEFFPLTQHLSPDCQTLEHISSTHITVGSIKHLPLYCTNMLNQQFCILFTQLMDLMDSTAIPYCTASVTQFLSDYYQNYYCTNSLCPTKTKFLVLEYITDCYLLWFFVVVFCSGSI